MMRDDGEGVTMAAQDTAGKWYMSDNAIFADAFNFLLYDGEPV